VSDEPWSVDPTSNEPVVADDVDEPQRYDYDAPNVEDADSSVYDCNDPVRRAEGFAAAKAALGESGLVVIPTDTVYGVAADAFDPTAVRRLLRAKGRGRTMPVPVLIGDVSMLRALASDVCDEAQALAEAFWPGGLTLICTQQSSLRWDLGDSRGTVALRVPDHEDARSLLQNVGPLAVSSANTTGDPPAVTIAEARSMLGPAIDVYLDAGPTPGPQPSSIVDVVSEPPRLVRAGVISAADLLAVVPELVVSPEAG
jgi:tRNA threonylcarbamoyl adenosine modification protein (Sua5/YciO/YrdC/YwlC family)